MAFTQVEQWSETAASNTEINGIVLSDSTQIDALDNIEREHMAQIAKWLGDDTLASAATADLGSVPGRYVSVTGTTTITALGTIKAGTVKYVKFTGILTLTHNATSLILPGAANIVTADGDVAVLVSEGSGNWRCLNYQKAAFAPRDFIITSWAAFTPTLSGFGTPSGVSFFSRRVGDTLDIMGKFVSGVPSATEAQITIGAGLTADATKVPSIRHCGYIVRSTGSDIQYHPLITASQGYLTIGIYNTTNDGLVSKNGNELVASGNTMSINASIPITGW